MKAIDTIPLANGWWPKLAFPYVLCGSDQVTVYDIQARQVVASVARGRPAGWLSPTRVLYTAYEDDAAHPDQRQFYTLTRTEAGTWDGPTPYRDWTPVGSAIVATHGHEDRVIPVNTRSGAEPGLYVDGRLFDEGQFLEQSVLEGADGTVAVVELVSPGAPGQPPDHWLNYRAWLLQDGQVLRRRVTPQTPEANVWLPGPVGVLTYGYWGRTHLNAPGAEHDITVTPWAREGVPWVTARDVLWAVRATEHPTLGPGLLSGPIAGPTPDVVNTALVQAWGVNVTSLQAQWIDTTCWIAASGDRGQLTVFAHSLDEPRTPLPPARPSVPPVQPPLPTRVTFSAPAAFTETPPAPVTVAPGIGVRCAYRVVDGPAPYWVEWEARLPLAAGDRLVRVTNPAEDPDHTFRLEAAGAWDVTLRARDQAGTVTAQTWARRQILVEAVRPPEPIPPEPEPKPPQPEPPPDEPTTTLQTEDGQHYVCAEVGLPDAPLNATRTDPYAWETFGVVTLAGGALALRAANHYFVSVQPDGRVLANGPSVGPWEPFTVEPQPEDRIALKTWLGTYLHAEDGGGKSLMADRMAVGPHEQFRASRPLTSGPGFAAWPPALLRDMRGNWTSGPFIGCTEAPGKTDVEQDWYLEQMVARGYQWCSVAIVNGSTGWAGTTTSLAFGSRRWRALVERMQVTPFGEAAPPGSPLLDHWRAYDGFGSGWPLLEAWLRKLAAAKIVPLLAPNQGAPESWAMLCDPKIYDHGPERQGYCNEWAVEHLPTWARQVDAVMGGHWGLLEGYEINETYPAFDGNPSHRGPGEKYGWNGISTMWAQSLKRACPHAAALLHLTPDTIGPQPGDGGRSWNPQMYWQNGHTATDDGLNHFDGLAAEYQLDGTISDAYLHDQTRRFLDVMAHGVPARVTCGFEYARPWAAESVSAQRARVIRDAGCANLLNGV